MPSLDEPMTRVQAEQILTQVGKVRKKKGHGWYWSELMMNPFGEGRVTCTFNVGIPTLTKWFKDAGANIFRIEQDRQTGNWKVWFEMKPLEAKTR